MIARRFSCRGLSAPGFGPVDLDLQSGDRLALSGASGSGKSRFLRALADLDVSEGRVELDGVSQGEISACQWRREVAYVPTESAWWAESVAEHFQSRTSLRDTASLPSRLDDDIAALGLASQVMDWPVQRLSSGERQRLAVLRQMSLEPALLMLDEPTANLDEENALRLEQWVLQRVEQEGMMLIWVSHHAAQRQRLATCEARMQSGRLQWI